MKALIILSLSIISLNVFAAAEVGEQKKGECTFSSQTSKRAAKEVVETESEEVKKEAPKAISK